MMNTNNLTVAKALYTAIGKKNLASVEQYIHPDIKFISPFSQIRGKTSYLDTVNGFTNMFNSLTIRAAFASDNQAMIVYDVDFPAPIGITPTAVLITFKDELIIKIELFFDARAFQN